MDHFSEFDAPVKVLSGPLTTATVELYKQVIEDYKAAPATPHYSFNMRDISKVFQGVLQSETKYYDTKDTMIRLWVHEVLRVFYDRLVSDDHRNQFVATINGKLVSILETNWKNVFSRGSGGGGAASAYSTSSSAGSSAGSAGSASSSAAGGSQGGVDHRLPMFGNFLEDVTASSSALEEKAGTSASSLSSTGALHAVRKAPYVELTHKYRDVKAYLERVLAEYNREPDVALTHPLPLVLFEQAVMHLSRLYRIISQPRGSALLIGMGGVGRQSLTRLAAYMCGHKVKYIETHRNYGKRVCAFSPLSTSYRSCAQLRCVRFFWPFAGVL
jgi:dynein heavy chain